MPSISKEQAALMMTLSNLAYLLPIFVLAFKLTPFAQERVPWKVAVPVMFLIFFIGIVCSWSYHSCSSDLAIHAGQDLESFDPLVADSCSRCKSTWHAALTWSNSSPANLLRFVDVFVTMFVMFCFFTYLVPIRSEVRHISTLFAFAWIIYFTTLQFPIVAAVPILVAAAAFFAYWYFHSHESRARNVSWSIGVVVTLAAFMFYFTELPSYFIAHQLWHELGGLAAAFLCAGIVVQPADSFPDRPFWSWLYDIRKRPFTIQERPWISERNGMSRDVSAQRSFESFHSMDESPTNVIKDMEYELDRF